MKARLLLPAWLIGVLLALVTIALYWPATGYDFFDSDDNLYIMGNIHVQSGLTWESIKWACLNPVCSNWHPLTLWSHMLVCQMCGVKPWGHHVANVLLHALNTALVFALFRQMTGATWRSVVAAALFGWHPAHVESVAWVAERKDVLSGFFGLLALMAYARYAEGQKEKAESREQKAESRREKAESRSQNPAIPTTQHAPRTTFHVSRFTSHAITFYFLSLFFFACGLMSKPMLVTWPFVMLLLDYWPLGRMQKAEGRMRNAEDAETHHAPRITPHISGFTFHVPLPLLIEKIPFFVLAAAASVVTFVAQRQAGSLASGENLPLVARGGNALVSYVRYLGKLFWPTDLAVFYPHPGQWPLGKVLLAGGLLLGISVLLFVMRRRYPYLLMGWLWYCGTLVPVSQVVQTGGHGMADRYTYIPSLGVLILTIWGVCELTRRWRYQALASWVAGGGAIVLCLGLTWQQIGYWKDSETLFRHALEVTENNSVAQNGYGNALGMRGQIDEAIRHLQEAVRLKPSHADPHYNLGIAFGKKGQLDEAIHELEEAIRLEPDRADAYDKLGAVLVGKGQIEEAIRQFQAAIRLNPDHAGAHYNLGVALGSKGLTDEAMGQYQEAARLKPDNADAHYNLGLALATKGQTDEAIRQFQDALKAKPDYPEAHNHLGLALVRKGQVDEATRQFQEALRLKPDYAGARRNLDAVLAARAHSPPPPGATTNP